MHQRSIFRTKYTNNNVSWFTQAYFYVTLHPRCHSLSLFRANQASSHFPSLASRLNSRHFALPTIERGREKAAKSRFVVGHLSLLLNCMFFNPLESSFHLVFRALTKFRQMREDAYVPRAYNFLKILSNLEICETWKIQ